MYCRFCGKEINDDAVFCRYCGKGIESSVKRETVITKNGLTFAGISFLLVAIHAGIVLIFIMVLNLEDTILVKSAFDRDASTYFTLKEFLDLLLKGNRIFNPTMLSTTIGIGMYLLIYSVPAFVGISLISVIVGKKAIALHTVFSVMATISSFAFSVLVPVSMKFVTGIKYAVANEAAMIYEDVESLSYTKLIIYAVIVIVLIAVAGIVVGLLNKRREKSC